MTSGSRDADDAQFAALMAEAERIRQMPPDEAFAQAGELVEKQGRLRGVAAAIRAEQALRVWTAGDLSVTALAERLGMTKSRASRLLKRARDEASEASTAPEPQPVVAAIVTRRGKVLVTKRRDGKPPWGFVSGEIEPGESQADAAVREVKEETGLVVRHGREIGRRIHPATGRTMIYMTADVVGRSGEVHVGDAAELEEVRWVTLAEADELLPGMYEPVRDYLNRVLRPRS